MGLAGIAHSGDTLGGNLDRTERCRVLGVGEEGSGSVAVPVLLQWSKLWLIPERVWKESECVAVS